MPSLLHLVGKSVVQACVDVLQFLKDKKFSRPIVGVIYQKITYLYLSPLS